MEELDFALACNKHSAWKVRLKRFLEGKEQLTADHAVSHRECDLGKWLYSDGMRLYGDLGNMQEMEKVHAQMHGYIGELINQQSRGNERQARELFDKVESCSDTVVDCLTSVEREIR